ncbi:MAG TPA: 4-(cytidine 5'-diphospho)-2-C-methyl-D-erythritol kinase [Chthoniobacterales bacterium]|nr:4-(cytidine 5'-diphospho)-2-C-methyl-D-erythritol kinase [Chthoniobacterales bacterium]
MQLYAPAKINLSLEIKGRREDGFHEIESLMTPIGLADRLTIERGESTGGIRFSCDDSSLSNGTDNLVVRAAELFRKATKIEAGIEIALEKKIPHGAGLGGGSSDAATTLLGLNELFETRLDRKDLMALAAQIGSDVPFFILGSAATCRGRGEIVEPAKLPMSFNLLLIKPDFGVPTPWAYQRWKSSRQLPGVDYAPQNYCDVQFVNDLERPVFEKFLLLGYLKTWLRLQPEAGAALLSGSGSTVFAVLREDADAEKLNARVRENIDPTLWISHCETIHHA